MNLNLNIFKHICCLLLLVTALFLPQTAWASMNKTIIFVPHDNRPISFKQTADNIRDLGYDVLTPPEELLGNREKPQGNPGKDWQSGLLKMPKKQILR